MDQLKYLRERDGLFCSSFEGVSCFLHNDHRWVLPLVHAMQNAGCLPTPCAWIMFDAHRDDFEPRCLERLAKLRRDGLTISALIELCASHLNKLDNDWLKAGMELGMFSDAVIFGAEYNLNTPGTFTDHSGTHHQIKFCSFPNLELGYQGKLSDVAKSRGLRPLWDILGWEPGSRFKPGLPRVGLDFDLDYFVINWKEYIFPWPEEVFEKELLDRSTYSATNGMSAADFIRGLVSKAGLIAIAREPMHCGGERKADWILERLNRYVFNGNLRFS